MPHNGGPEDGRPGALLLQSLPVLCPTLPCPLLHVARRCCPRRESSLPPTVSISSARLGPLALRHHRGRALQLPCVHTVTWRRGSPGSLQRLCPRPRVILLALLPCSPVCAASASGGQLFLPLWGTEALAVRGVGDWAVSG